MCTFDTLDGSFGLKLTNHTQNNTLESVMQKIRVQLSLDPKVYALIEKSQANKSRYVERLIVEDFKSQKADIIINRVKLELLSDTEFIGELKSTITKHRTISDSIEITDDWGA